jgi:hypothetical protein
MLSLAWTWNKGMRQTRTNNYAEATKGQYGNNKSSTCNMSMFSSPKVAEYNQVTNDKKQMRACNKTKAQHQHATCLGDTNGYWTAWKHQAQHEPNVWLIKRRANGNRGSTCNMFRRHKRLFNSMEMSSSTWTKRVINQATSKRRKSLNMQHV